MVEKHGELAPECEQLYYLYCSALALVFFCLYTLVVVVHPSILILDPTALGQRHRGASQPREHLSMNAMRLSTNERERLREETGRAGVHSSLSDLDGGIVKHYMMCNSCLSHKHTK